MRRSVILQAIAFALLLASAAAFFEVARGLLESTRLMWVSTVLSALAIVTAALAVVPPRRR